MDRSSLSPEGRDEDDRRPVGPVAADWLGVRIDRGRFSRVLSAVSVVMIFLVVFVTFGSFGQDLEPWERCKVVVFRKSDGRALTEYTHWSAVDAHQHVGSLSARLSTTDVATMSRDLGLDLATVQTW